MSGDTMETRVVWLGQGPNMTFTTLLPNYTSVNDTDGNMSSMVPPTPNMCRMKPPMEKWEVDLGFYLNGVITILVIVLGLVGNMLTVIVLTNKTMRTSTNCFLMALAIWDTIVLLVTFFLICVGEFTDEYMKTVFPYIVAFIYPLGLVAQTITIWLTVSFTVERYIAVCHPLKAAVMCTIPRARIVITGVCFISLFYNMPRWFEYKVLAYTHSPTNDSCTIIEPTPFSRDQLYHKIYFGWSYFLVMCFIPLLSLAVLNTFLILAVRRSKAQRKDMNVRQSRENNVTIMLIAVVLLFMLFQVPALIYNMAYAINTATTTSSFGWKVLSSIRNFLVNLNSAVNFILYCALGQKFRRTFVRTFCPKLRKSMDNFHSFSNNYKMDKIKKTNGTTKYVKMAAKNNHPTSTTGDSGVITKSAGFSRYSSPVSVSKLSAKCKESNGNQNIGKPDVIAEKSSDVTLDKNVDKENNVTLESNVEKGESMTNDEPVVNGSNDTENVETGGKHSDIKEIPDQDSVNPDQSDSKDTEDPTVVETNKDETGENVPKDNTVSSDTPDNTVSNDKPDNTVNSDKPDNTVNSDKPDNTVNSDKPDNNVPNGKSVALPNHVQNDEHIPNENFSENENYVGPEKSELTTPLLLLLENLRESEIL